MVSMSPQRKRQIVDFFAGVVIWNSILERQHQISYNARAIP